MPNAQQFRGVIFQRITNIVQAQGVSELRIQQGDQMRPRTERAGLFINSKGTGGFRDQMPRNQVAQLSENSEILLGRFAWNGTFLSRRLCR